MHLDCVLAVVELINVMQLKVNPIWPLNPLWPIWTRLSQIKAFYLQQIFAVSLLVAVDLDIWLWYNYSNKTSQNIYGMGWEVCEYIGPSDKANIFPFLSWLFLQFFSFCVENIILNTFFQVTFPSRRCLIENILFQGVFPNRFSFFLSKAYTICSI